MIQEIRSFARYEEFIRKIAADPDRKDPHFTYNEDNLYRAMENPNAKAYIVTENDVITGLFVWLVLPEEAYIELLVGLSGSGDAFREMLAFLEREYPHCQMDFVISPRNTALRQVLEEKKAAFDPEQVKMRWEGAAAVQPHHNITLLSPAFEEQYRTLHDTETYWTADKVLAAGDRFRVFIAAEGQRLLGYLDVTCAYEENEPYALWVDEAYAGQGYEEALLAAAAAANAPNRMIAFIDADDAAMNKIYRAAGFVPVAGQNHIYASYRHLTRTHTLFDGANQR